MKSSYELLTHAKNFGRYAADLMYSGGAVNISAETHHAGDDLGRLVLEAYRQFGSSAILDVVKAYQSGYNNQAAELGGTAIRRIQIKNGIHCALSEATDEEVQIIQNEL